MVSFGDLHAGLKDRSEVANDPHYVEEVVREIIDFYVKLVAEREVQGDFEPGGEWKNYIDDREDFFTAIERNDFPETLNLLTNFWRNNFGPIVSQYSYFEALERGESLAVDRFIENLQRDFSTWQTLWQEGPTALEVPNVGNPWGLVIDNVLVSPLAMRFDTHARQIAELLRGVEKPIVAEIGGGYGGMAHALRRYTDATYLDFDLPQTLILAAFYIRLAMPHLRVLLATTESDVKLASSGEFDVVLAPNWLLEALPSNSVHLFLNAFSLSEMPAATVTRYCEEIARCCQRWFLQNNVDRAGVINRGFERIPCSKFPLSREKWRTIYFKHDTFQGPNGDYRESLYELIR
jgi:hypothetical protein